MRNLALIWTLLALASPAVAAAADAKWDCENLDSDAMDPTGWKATLAGPDSVKAGEAATYTFDVSILPDHVLYQERADVSLAEDAKDVTIGKATWPATKRKFDKLLGKEVDYWDAASMKVSVPVTFTGKPGKRTLELTITNQACNPCLCLFPTPVTLTKSVEVKKAVAEAPAATPSSGETGFLTYRAVGDTKIELDGVAIKDWRGNTDLATPAGKHSVKFTGADGKTATREFVVKAGERLVVVADLATGLVRVDAARPLTEGTPGIAAATPAPVETATPVMTPAPPKIAATSSAISSQDRMKELIETNFALALLVSFAGGVLISLTPCVYPMIPITVAVIGNQATKGDASASQSRMRGFLLSLVYVAGITAVYATLGVVAAKSGNEFGFLMRNPFVLLGVAAVFLALAASMFGAFEIQLPTSLQTRLSSYQGSGTAGVFVTGLFAGVVAGPCTAPVLIGILLAISAGSVGAVGGFALMTSFSVGMGLLFIAIGTFSGLLSNLPRSGTWMVTVKYVFGAMLVGAALYFLSLALPKQSQWIFAMAVGASLVMAGMALGAMMRLEAGAPLSDRMRQGLGWVAAVIGVWFLLGGLSTSGYGPQWLPAGNLSGAPGVVLASHKAEPPWITDEAAGVKTSVATGKPMVIDFWAEDCRACKELDEYTYTDARVIDVMKSDFVPVKIDLSTPLGTPRERKDLIEALKKKYKVAGLPKVVFIRPDGTEIDKELTLYGFEPADDFLKRMDAARGCAPDATTC